MGENEQGGMLRTVVVIGLVAIIAIVMVVGVVGLKSSLRTNTLMAKTMGQNVLQLKQNGTDTRYKFNQLSGSEQIQYNDSTGVFDVTLAANSGNQGMYYGPGGGAASKDYDAFLAGDKYQITADMRSDNASLFSNIDYSIYFESSQPGGMYLHPTMSGEWQHYETNGVKLDTWGAPMFYFNNSSGKVVHVQVKNIKLIRVA